MSLAKKFKKSANWSVLFVRLAVGLVFLVHGFGKLFGVGPFPFGLSGTAGFLAGLGFPSAMFFAWVLALVETLGGLAIILGLFTRYAALLVGIDMIFALLLVHIPSGFYESNGEIALVLLLAAISLLFSGAGKHLVLEKAWFSKER